MQKSVPTGVRVLTPKLTCQKFSRRKSWLWDRLKTDPTFPRPVYIGPHAPVFLEHELDAWLAARVQINRNTATEVRA